MKKYAELTAAEQSELLSTLKAEYNEYMKKGLSLDLSRGKPNSDQLDISQGLLTAPVRREDCFINGLDCRNYGVLEGMVETKELFADIYGLNKNDILIGGNSSLQLMYDTLTRAMLFGVYGSPRPWCQEKKIKWICITPGYDRHFRITETLGFELVSVKMLPDGPDMDMVEELVRDPMVKGIWCVPKYSNPTGNTYSEEVVRRLAKMRCAAPDFRIMWDNAYAIHDLYEKGDELVNIFDVAKEYGTEDRIFYFTSTSKVTFPGAGVSLMAMSENNRKQIAPYFGAQTIGYDKINQLRHIIYFKNAENVKLHMKKMAGVLKNKFEITESALSALDGLGIAEWTNPKGGYFVSLDVMPGTASRVYSLMSAVGVALTPVGATHPYGVDPEDKNLRIAPTYPSDSDLKTALEILVLSTKIAALEKLTAK